MSIRCECKRRRGGRWEAGDRSPRSSDRRRTRRIGSGKRTDSVLRHEVCDPKSKLRVAASRWDARIVIPRNTNHVRLRSQSFMLTAQFAKILRRGPTFIRDKEQRQPSRIF